MPKRKFTKEFKEKALSLANDIGGAQAARNLEINSSLIYRWRHEQNSDGQEAFRGHGRMKPEQAEIARLKRQIANISEENEILKKAITIFSKPQ